MFALGLSLALFLFWTLVGYAVLSPAPGSRRLAETLLAPVIGLCVTYLPIYVLNRVGLPIGMFGVALAVALAGCVAFRLWRSRPGWSPAEIRPFAVVLLLGAVSIGFPMLLYGFDWLSVCNGDMTNYCLHAQRLLDDGFYDPPTLEQLQTGSDHAREMWLFFAAGGIRSGVDQTLAWVMSLTGLSALSAFMPLIVAFHLVQIAASGALAAVWAKERRAAWWTCAWMACSALFALGTVLQLLGQVPGIALLTGCVALLLREFDDLTPGGRVRQGLLLGLTSTSLALMYPEVSPFLVLAYVLYLLVNWRLFFRELRHRLTVVGVALGGMALIINVKLPIVAHFVLLQGQSGGSKDTIELFQYYRRPGGLASLWGLKHTYASLHEPLQSLSIALGAALTVAALYFTLRMARRNHPGALMIVVMGGMAGWLFYTGSGFGLFKLVQFAQPFLLTTVVAYLCTHWSPRRAAVAMTGLMVIGLPGFLGSIDNSRGTPDCYHGATAQIFNPSAGRLHAVIHDYVAANPDVSWILGVADQPLINIMTASTRGRTTFAPMQGRVMDDSDCCIDPDAAELARQLNTQLDVNYPVAWFNLHNARRETSLFRMNLIAQELATSPATTQLMVPSRQGVATNGRLLANQTDVPVLKFNARDIQNLLLIQRSSQGEHWGAGITRADPHKIGVFGMERDQSFPGERMLGLGRFSLFEVLHPTDTVRLVMDMTTSFVRADRRLPAADAVGAERVPFEFTGCGAARVVSAPFHPQIINGRAYVAFDMNRDGQFPEHRPTGLMALYGRDVREDERCLVVHARDLSLVTEAEYQSFQPPQRLTSFPQDLAHRDLEFSGIFEEGWVSQQAYFRLARPATPAELVIRGMVPGFDAEFSPELVVRLDGHEVSRRRLCPGEFDVSLVVPGGADRSRIDLSFSDVRPLGAKDSRTAACLLKEIGFATATPAATASAATAAKSRLETLVGLTHDRWVNRDGFSLLLSPQELASQSALVVRGDWPEPCWTGAPRPIAELLLPNGQVESLAAALHIERTSYELVVPFNPRVCEAPAVVRVRFDSAFRPHDLNGSADRRELVAHAPKYAQLRAIAVAGGTPDGWITNAGVTLEVPAAVLTHGSQVVLNGRWETGGLKETPQAHAELLIPGEDPETIPVTLQIEKGRYQLTALWGPRCTAQDAEIRVTFDRDFSFAERKPGNADTRRLVTRMPDGGELLR